MRRCEAGQRLTPEDEITPAAADEVVAALRGLRAALRPTET
jgi:hypothetical protein